VLSKTSRKDVAKDKISEAVAAAGDAAEAGRDRIVPVVETAAATLADAAEPQLTKAKKSARKAAQKTSAALADVASSAEPELSTATKSARKAAEKAAKQAAKKAKVASDQLYAALPEQTRTTVELAVPAMATKRRKKGKLFIAFGLLAGAGAVALFLNGKKNSAGSASGEFPKIERRDALAAEAVDDGPAPVSATDDAVGTTEEQVDAAVSGTRRGRHAARE